MIQPAASEKKYWETLLTVWFWMTITPCGIDFRITPCQISYPASVTTNDGTPISATIEPWNAPIAVPTMIAARIAIRAGYSCPLPGTWSCATTTPATPLT